MKIGSSENLEEVEAINLLKRLKLLAALGAIAIVLILGVYFYTFHGKLLDKPEGWGQFGDFVGGILNPTFSLLALIALLSTFSLQIREFRMSTEELKNSAIALQGQNEAMRRQSFENSFFQLLALHNEIVGGIDLKSNSGVVSGRDCFAIFQNRLEARIPTINNIQDIEKFKAVYDSFYKQHEREIGHYFRMLYSIIKVTNNTTGIEKRFYTNIVRAQLSSPEITLLFYNCLSKWGDEKFKPLVEEFALLKNITNIDEKTFALVQGYEPAAFGGTYPPKHAE